MNPQHKLNKLANRERRIARQKRENEERQVRINEYFKQISRQSYDATRAPLAPAESTLTVAQAS